MRNIRIEIWHGFPNEVAVKTKVDEVKQIKLLFYYMICKELWSEQVKVKLVVKGYPLVPGVH